MDATDRHVVASLDGPDESRGDYRQPADISRYHEMSREVFGLSFGLLTGSIGKIRRQDGNQPQSET
jgi:hypothetical protein